MKVAVSGVGFSDMQQGHDRPLLSLAGEAIQRAVSDAGLTRADIDGVATYNGVTEWADVAKQDGEDFVSVRLVTETLGLGGLTWYQEHAWGPATLTSIAGAEKALLSGDAKYIVVYRAMSRPRGRRLGEWSALSAGGESQFTAPIGYPWVPAMFALSFRMYMERYGFTEMDQARLAVLLREQAVANPHAAYRDPITVEDYLRSPYVADPLRALDCDRATDAAVAIVLTTTDRAADGPHVPVQVVGDVLTTAASRWESDDPEIDMRHMPGLLWERVGLSPTDVSFAQLYDGFSPSVFTWLHVLGLSEPDQTRERLEKGDFRLGGTLPVNTGGGSHSGGRLHGLNHVAEAVLQLSGRAGVRQIPDAQTGVLGMGQVLRPPLGGPGGTPGAILLARG